jgi:hypothetical protein
VRLCTEQQRQTIRALLGRAGQTEEWLLAKLRLERLDDVPYARAEQVIRRLAELARERANRTALSEDGGHSGQRP